MTSYPDTTTLPLARQVSDHLPCMIKIGTTIPKSKIFRFENYWLKHDDFKDVVRKVWVSTVRGSDIAKTITAKFKVLRRDIKIWAKFVSCLKQQIAELNECIFSPRFIEEFRFLSSFEWNCRHLLKETLLNLLQHQQIYWKQRGKIKGVKFGDENTNFFHTKATTNHRHNNIAIMLNEDTVEISDHAGKAAILWDSFKKRLVHSEGHKMFFDLPHLYDNNVNPQIFQDLEIPFSDEEINDVVKNLPSDKSLGLDGFNNEFLKSCWDIIGHDVRQLIHAFHAGSVDIESINSSFITLIPKKEVPRCPNDFRPISLLNGVLKIITKLLANRLQKIILQLIHINQYGFLKGRVI